MIAVVWVPLRSIDDTVVIKSKCCDTECDVRLKKVSVDSRPTLHIQWRIISKGASAGANVQVWSWCRTGEVTTTSSWKLIGNFHVTRLSRKRGLAGCRCGGAGGFYWQVQVELGHKQDNKSFAPSAGRCSRPPRVSSIWFHLEQFHIFLNWNLFW